VRPLPQDLECGIRGNELQVDVNEHSFLLTFNEAEGRWYLVTPTFGHLQAIRVINDDDAAMTVDVTMDAEGQSIIN
jgi:hypothetical protein